MDHQDNGVIPWEWVDSPRQLCDIAMQVKKTGLMCLDTEYDSFRYFYDKLCLIQINTGNRTFLIDPLDGLDLSLMGDLSVDPKIIKVLHAGDNDIRLIRRDYGFEFRNIFDTHRAAAMLGCHYLALSTLINQYLGVEFAKKKKIQRSQWDNRPLSKEQLDYAAQDTAYLPALYRRLDGELRQRGMEQEAAKHFDHIASLTWRLKDFDPQGYKRIHGAATLNAVQKQSLKTLFLWRYRKAREINRALFMILPNQSLLDLAKADLDGIEDLIGIISSDKAAQYGKDIIHTLKQ